MHFEIAHAVTYAYSREVFCEPHTIRLRPRSDPAQRVERFALDVSPEPAGVSEGLDAWGNEVAWAWFSGTTDRLEIRTEATVATRRENPFDYIVARDVGPLPIAYEPGMSSALAPYLDTPPDPVAKVAKGVADEVDGELVPFLGRLTDRLHEEVEVIFREEGDAWPPEETLERGRGACRDLTVLQAAACRAMGIAARFVSGYQAGDPDQSDRDLHAWVEAYVPGGGWRGYDPTLGLAVADAHVPVAAAADAAGAAPTAGSVRGTGVRAEMRFDVEIRTSP